MSAEWAGLDEGCQSTYCQALTLQSDPRVLFLKLLQEKHYTRGHADVV